MSLANYITLLRILLTPFFFTALVSYVPEKPHYRWLAFGLLFIAVLTDALDGFLARFLKKQTPFGKFLDPLADKLLLLSGYLGLLFVHALTYRPPLWVTVTIVFRDLVILSGLILIFLMSGKLPIEPNWLGKWTTAFQMATLVAILLEWQISVGLWYVTAGLSILSCLAYVVRELRKIRKLT